MIYLKDGKQLSLLKYDVLNGGEGIFVRLCEKSKSVLLESFFFKK